MVRRLLILVTAIALLQACAGSQAPTESTCPDGIVLHPMWQGEYPAPAIQVIAQVELPAYADPCDQVPKQTCVLEPAIYHPWGEGTEFATLRPIVPYRAREPESARKAPCGPVFSNIITTIVVEGVQGPGKVAD